MDIYEAYSEIKKIRDVRQFTGILYGLSFVGVALFFTMMLGGDFTDCMVAGVAGLAMAITQWALVPFGFNSFFLNMISTLSMALTAVGFQRFVFANMNIDLVIIGGIMPIVPGVIFTTAMRDTLNGDYTAGVSRMLETGVVAFCCCRRRGTGICDFVRRICCFKIIGAFIAVVAFVYDRADRKIHRYRQE